MKPDLKTLTERLQRRTVVTLAATPVSPDDAGGVKGIVDAVVAVYDCETAYGTAIRPGCFTASLSRKLPKVCMGHDWGTVVGKTTEAYDLNAGDKRLPMSVRDRGALLCRAQFNLDTQAGAEAFSNVSGGFIDEFSVGFMPRRWEWSEDDEMLYYLEADLIEWSPVVAGACPDTQTVSVMAAPRNGGLTMAEHSEQVLNAVQELMARLKGHAELYTRDGRELSDAQRARIDTHADAVAALSAEYVAFKTAVTAPQRPDTSRVAELAFRTLASRGAARPETFA